MSFSTILVPIDYEAAADAALRTAGRLARAGKTRLLIVHVLPLPIYTIAELPVPAIDGQWVRGEVQRLRAHVVSVLERDGEVPTFDVDVGFETPPLRIIQLAAERRANLIVMGTHGRTGFRHLLLGSTAEQVVRLAPCPVLTVHGESVPGRDARTDGDTGQVGELMRPVPITIAPDAMLEEARIAMGSHRVRHLPVVDHGKLVGMLSSGDLGPYVGHLQHTKVNAVMTADPASVTPTVGAAAAARLMLQRRVRALPVVDGERVVGVLSASDILEEYARAARG